MRFTFNFGEGFTVFNFYKKRCTKRGEHFLVEVGTGHEHLVIVNDEFVTRNLLDPEGFRVAHAQRFQGSVVLRS